jgi:F-type H+-transporting ATPase subunit alpha
VSVEKQVAVLYAGTNGYMDDVPLSAIGKFEQEFLNFFSANKADILKEIIEKKALSPELIEKLKAAIGEFKKQFVA